MGEQINRPLTEGVGVKPTSQKPTLGRSNGMDSMSGNRPASDKPKPPSSQSNTTQTSPIKKK